MSLLTLKGDFTLSASTADDMAELVTMFLSGLTERSQYAVALKEGDTQGQGIKVLMTFHFSLLCTHCLTSSFTDDPTFLRFKKGELILIIKDNEFSHQRGWIKGQNTSTGKTGAVPTDAILIIPTLTKPTSEVMVRGVFVRVSKCS